MLKSSQELILATPGYSGSCSWSFLGYSWLPVPRWACQGTGCPNPTRRFSWPLLGALGLLLELPGLLLAALSHVGQDAQIQPGAFPGHSWVLLGCSWNFPGPVMPCALCASMQRSRYPRAPNWDKNVMGGMGGKAQGFSKNPKP